MIRFLRRVVALLLILLALGAVAFKGWLDVSGPFVEALPEYPYCDQAASALHDDRVADALELASAGGCTEVEREARAAYDGLAATFSRCVDSVWTGEAEDVAGLTCAVASDLVIFGDVRDLTRQGLNWSRGESTDPVLIALSATGIALTLAPQIGAGTSLLKIARRAGTLSERLASSVMSLLRRGAWRPLRGLMTDAGRISAKLGPAKATRALAYADDVDDVADVARFVEAVDQPLLGLRWGGRATLRLADDPELYQAALRHGPSGVALAARRGSSALLARKPLILTAAKTVKRNPEALAMAAAALARWLLRMASWTAVLITAGALLLLAALVRPRRRRRRRRGPPGRGSQLWRAT